MVKLTKFVLTAAALASLALAQTSATKPPTVPAKTTPATATKHAAAPPTKALTTKPAPKVATKPPAKALATKPAPKSAAATAKPTAAQTAKAPSKAAPMKEAKPKAEKPAAAKTTAAPTKKYAARRDPFLNPIKMRNDNMASATACTTGARCLMIDQVVLKGVVKTQQGMIAMVENSAKKQYNLREKDPVYNGFVMKITGDSVVFKENTTDNSGKPTTREVVKRVTVPVV